jgi:hypothetical protein
MHDLARIQRWMQAVVMHPGDVADGVATAHEHLDVTPEEIERVLTRSQALPALDRLGIYNAAYHARLLECLREEHPVLVRAMTQEVFDTFAVGYLQAYPSHSYTLAHLGNHFPRYLAETREAVDAEAKAAATWPDFLIDLAQLEVTFNEVFDGPGVEGKPALDLVQVMSVDPKCWPQARLLPVGCLRLLALTYPVDVYYQALRDRENSHPPEPGATFLAITRRDYIVHHYRLERAEYELLQALVSGYSVGGAIDRAARVADVDAEQSTDDVRGWFRDWTARGFFSAVLQPN